MIDLIGKKFGRLVVIKKGETNKQGNYQWLCLCDCCVKKMVNSTHLITGHTKSCGCFKKEVSIKHGHTEGGQGTRIYRIWKCMTQRCTNPNNTQWKNYGGRGITVCERWMKFPNFLEDMGEPSTENHSIDRIDNNKGYHKENCRWATSKEQARNTNKNRVETYNGKTQCIADWAQEWGIDQGTLWYRIVQSRWSIQKALTTPVRKYKKGRKSNDKQ